MPPLNTHIPIIPLTHGLLPLGPSHPLRFTLPQDTNHLLRDGQLRVDRGREGVEQLRPVVVPEPEHGGAGAAEGALGGDFFFVGGAAVFDRRILPMLRPVSSGSYRIASHLIPLPVSLR